MGSFRSIRVPGNKIKGSTCFSRKTFPFIDITRFSWPDRKELILRAMSPTELMAMGTWISEMIRVCGLIFFHSYYRLSSELYTLLLSLLSSLLNSPPLRERLSISLWIFVCRA